MAISTIGTDALASAAVTSAKLASGAPSRSQLPAGTVLQVVSAATNTQVSTTSATYVSTGFSATITPTSSTSKILVLFNAGGIESTSGTTASQVGFQIWRNAASVFTVTNGGMYGTYASLGPSASYLDSPSTTSATTYTIYYYSQGGGRTIYFCTNTSGATLTLMEIAA